jgi:hypothetical protein
MCITAVEDVGVVTTTGFPDDRWMANTVEDSSILGYNTLLLGLYRSFQCFKKSVPSFPGLLSLSRKIGMFMASKQKQNICAVEYQNHRAPTGM